MSKTKLKDFLAEVVSRVFDPVWEIPLALLLAVYFAMQEGLRWRFLGLLLFVDAVLPMIFFLVMLFNKQIRTWDIRERKERLPLYFFTLICHLGGVWLAHELGRAELALILFVYLVIGVLFATITIFWKISLHTGVNAVLIMSLNLLANWRWWWMMAILPLVSWARVYQKHHSWQQVLGGAFLGGGMVWVLFGLWL